MGARMWILLAREFKKKLAVIYFLMQTLPSPRTFKCHLPYFMMPRGGPAKSSAKYIYVMRNPKDTAVSFFHHVRAFPYYKYDGDWDDFFEHFMNGNMDSGYWFDHVLPWWAHKGIILTCNVHTNLDGI